jgi:hypothetical protein
VGEGHDLPGVPSAGGRGRPAGHLRVGWATR